MSPAVNSATAPSGLTQALLLAINAIRTGQHGRIAPKARHVYAAATVFYKGLAALHAVRVMRGRPRNGNVS